MHLSLSLSLCMCVCVCVCLRSEGLGVPVESGWRQRVARVDADYKHSLRIVQVLTSPPPFPHFFLLKKTSQSLYTDVV